MHSVFHRSLDVSGCKNIGNNGIRMLGMACQQLEFLDVSSTACTHKALVWCVDCDMFSERKYMEKTLEVERTEYLLKMWRKFAFKNIENYSCRITSLANYCNRRLEILKVNFCKNITEQNLVKLATQCRR